MRGTIDKSQIALGGITIKSTKDYVRSIYGTPTKIENNGLLYKYGDSFSIKFIRGTEFGMMEPAAYDIVSSAPNGISTPAGISVGMRVENVFNAYGEPDNIEEYKNGKILYEYWDAQYYKISLGFLVSNGKIIQIECYYYV